MPFIQGTTEKDNEILFIDLYIEKLDPNTNVGQVCEIYMGDEIIHISRESLDKLINILQQI